MPHSHKQYFIDGLASSYERLVKDGGGLSGRGLSLNCVECRNIVDIVHRLFSAFGVWPWQRKKLHTEDYLSHRIIDLENLLSTAQSILNAQQKYLPPGTIESDEGMADLEHDLRVLGGNATPQDIQRMITNFERKLQGYTLFSQEIQGNKK